MRDLFLLFIIYAFIGWCIEVIFWFLTNKKIVNRGFFIGPYCPIYGVGALLIYLLLERYKSDIAVLFLMSIFMCSILEYFTSYILEKVFHARWWDYRNYKFNINGRICLETMIPFGLLGIVMIYVLNPFILGIIALVPNEFLNIISIIIALIFIIDMSISFKILGSIRKTMNFVSRDYTEEITQKVKEVFLKKGKLYKRVVLAFPNLEIPKRYLIKLKNKVNKSITGTVNKIKPIIKK